MVCHSWASLLLPALRDWRMDDFFFFVRPISCKIFGTVGIFYHLHWLAFFASVSRASHSVRLQHGAGARCLTGFLKCRLYSRTSATTLCVYVSVVTSSNLRTFCARPVGRVLLAAGVFVCIPHCVDIWSITDTHTARVGAGSTHQRHGPNETAVSIQEEQQVEIVASTTVLPKVG